MKKNVLILCLAIVAIIGTILLKRGGEGSFVDVTIPTATSSSSVSTTTPNTSTSTPTKGVISTTTPKKVRTAAELEKEAAWLVFDAFVQAAQKHDLEKVKSLSHQQSDQCKDSAREKECFELMDSVYLLGSVIKKDAFTLVWSDAKQLILSTPFKRYVVPESVGYEQGVVYFTKVGGVHKILSYNPARAAALPLEGKNSNDPGLEEKLQTIMKDSDRDGVTDQFESCAGEYANIPGCKETNPNIRDTDGDGWWDGIERFFYIQI